MPVPIVAEPFMWMMRPRSNGTALAPAVAGSSIKGGAVAGDVLLSASVHPVPRLASGSSSDPRKASRRSRSASDPGKGWGSSSASEPLSKKRTLQHVRHGRKQRGRVNTAIKV